MRQALSLINQLVIPHLKFASDLQLSLQFKIRRASDTQKLSKFACIQSSMSFGNIARY